MSTTLLHTACNRDCPDACGIVATVEDGRVLALAGDPEHPVTRGFLCERTSRFLRRQYDPARLTQPLVRGETGFVEASWDEALERVASGLERIRRESGAEAVLHYRSGGSLGALKILNDWFFECFGGARVKKGDICSGAGEAAQVADMGVSDSSDLDDLLHSRSILLWGKGVTTSFVHMLPVLKQARKRGAAIVLIDPAPGKTARFADLVVSPRPGTDRFLALGIAHWIAAHGGVDPTLDEWSVGSAAFVELARSRSLNQWAGACELEPGALESVAQLYARSPANIQVGWGLQRRLHGGATVRVLDALAAMSGNLGVSGGGVTFYYKRRRAFDTERWAAPDSRRGIPEPLLGEGILAATDPPVRAVVIDNGNPVAMLPDSHTVARALETRELVVVLDQFMTDTAARAHVVLPVTTMLEEEDLIGAYGHHYLRAAQPVARRPQGVRTDLEIYQALATRLGFGDKLAGSARDWCEKLLAPVQGRVTVDMLQNGPVRNPLAAQVLFADRKFFTADGMFHFVERVALETEKPNAEFPLTLGSFSTSEAQSSQWSRPVAGQPFTVRCHPSAAPWATEGVPARLCSRSGSMAVRVHLDAAVHPSLVCIPKGGWLVHGQAANVLVRASATDIGLGACYYDEPVRLEPGNGAHLS